MNRVLVLFASYHGQTRRIAFRIAETLRARGLHVHLRDLADEQPDPAGFAAVIVGAPVHMSRHHPAIASWLERHAATLATRPGAFFSVSMSASSARATVRREIEQIAATFLAGVGWRPTHVATFGGALRYTQYGWLTRQLMKLVVGSQGRPTDTSRDHEFTDWPQVDRFSADLLRALHVAAPGAAQACDVALAPT